MLYFVLARRFPLRSIYSVSAHAEVTNTFPKMELVKILATRLSGTWDSHRRATPGPCHQGVAVGFRGVSKRLVIGYACDSAWAESSILVALRFRHGSRSRIWNLHRTPVPRSNRPTHSFVGVAGELGYAGRPQPKSLPPGLFACSQFPDDHSERARVCRVVNGCDWGGSRHWGWGWTLCWPVVPGQRPGPRSGNRHLLAGPSRASCCSCSGRRLTRTVGT